MPIPSWFTTGTAAVALVGGGAVAAVVIASSGPFSRDQSRQATPSTEVAGTVHPSTSFRATDRFDFSQIPVPDQSSWARASGPRGRLSVKVPPGWKVESGEVEGVVDYQGTVGEWIQITKPLPIVRADGGRTIPGWVSIIVSTQPFSRKDRILPCDDPPQRAVD